MNNEKATMNRVYWRLVPCLFLLLLVNWLDRVNISFAALEMNRDLGLSATAFGFGASIFVIGYAVFELPSNAILYRIGARRWLGIIMITWGLISGAMMLARNNVDFYVLRFLLGVAEAGFMPGLIFYLSAWFPKHYRSRANAGVLMATVLGPATGSVVSGLLMKTFEGFQGIAGWRWMFFFEALPAVVLGFCVFYWLTDRPARATWMTLAERDWLSSALEAERRHLAQTANLSLMQVLQLKRVWALCMLFSCLLTALYGVLLWAPQIIQGLGDLTDLEVALLGSLPFGCAAVALPLIARSSDRTKERRAHVGTPMLVGGLALLLSAYAPNTCASLALLCIAAACIWGCLGVFWTMTSIFLTGPAAALGIAVINSVAQVGGLIGPLSVGIIRDQTGSFNLALAVLSGFALLGAVIAFRLEDVNEIAPSLAIPVMRKPD
jgi:MFS family permease